MDGPFAHFGFCCSSLEVVHTYLILTPKLWPLLEFWSRPSLFLFKIDGKLFLQAPLLLSLSYIANKLPRSSSPMHPFFLWGVPSNLHSP